MSGSASMVWTLPFTSRLIRAIGCMSPLGKWLFAAVAPPRPAVDVRDQLRMVLMREASPTARSLEHPRRGFLAAAARGEPVGTRAKARLRPRPSALPPPRCDRAPGGDTPLASFPIHNVKQRSLLRSHARCCARVCFLLPRLDFRSPDRGDGGAP